MAASQQITRWGFYASLVTAASGIIRMLWTEKPWWAEAQDAPVAMQEVSQTTIKEAPMLPPGYEPLEAAQAIAGPGIDYLNWFLLAGIPMAVLFFIIDRRLRARSKAEETTCA